jgi:hypothetical protein
MIRLVFHVVNKYKYITTCFTVYLKLDINKIYAVNTIHICFLEIVILIADKADHKYLGSFEICCWRRMEEINWTNRVTNGVLLRVKEKKNNLHAMKRGTLTGLVTSCVGTVFLITLLKERQKEE